MRDAGGVERGKRRNERHPQFGHLGLGEAAFAVESVRQRPGIDRHREEGMVRGFVHAKAENGNDAWMSHRREGLCLGKDVFPGGHGGTVQNLERDFAAKILLPCEPDIRHAARTERMQKGERAAETAAG